MCPLFSRVFLLVITTLSPIGTKQSEAFDDVGNTKPTSRIWGIFLICTRRNAYSNCFAIDNRLQFSATKLHIIY